MCEKVIGREVEIPFSKDYLCWSYGKIPIW